MITTINTLAFVYQIISKFGIVLYTGLAMMMLCTIVVKFIIFKKYDILSTILLALLIAVAFLDQSNKNIYTIIVILLYVLMLLRMALMVYKYLCTETHRQKIEDHIKNDTTDFFISMDKKNRIVSSSISFAQMTRLTKKELEKKDGWKLIFDTLDVHKINGEEFITSNRELFLSHLDEVLSKYKMYEFTIDLRLREHDEITHYYGFIQAIYFKDKKIGSAVYFYSDKQTLISSIKGKLDGMVNNLYNHKNVLHILMSLSEGVALYYDYQERLFFATQSFLDFTETEKQTYTFKEFYEMIADVDKDRYNEQSAVVSSVSATRIKFKLRVKNTYFNAIEDSIYLTRDGEEYISIVHITSRTDEATNDKILSTKESTDLLSSLAETPIAPAVYKVEELLNESLKDDLDEE